jgi:hypothetical protein
MGAMQTTISEHELSVYSSSKRPAQLVERFYSI